jgi:hypothetical protein
MTPEINALAAKIAHGGFRWVEDGGYLKKICDLLTAQVVVAKTKEGKAQLREWLVSNLKMLDRMHGWKMAGKTQEQEDALYGMFVDLLLK